MKRFDATASLLLALGIGVLAGCGDLPWQLDAFKLNGPLNGHGVGAALDYPTLMRVGAAAEAGGDFATAATTYRRAAAGETTATGPLVASRSAVLAMGEVNEAIGSYHSARAV